ncbi:MAG TPA: M20 family metallopeptidase [Candidatus Limnocylindria bacterium]|nr:M20 family metallopeptidase [Candidatus Limnocylindria bacterium]
MTMEGAQIENLLGISRGREEQMLRLLKQFVECESPSHDKPAVDRMGRVVASEWRRRVARVSVLKQATRGNHIRAEMWLGGGQPAGQILVLGHLDTVYPQGSLRKMRFRVKGGAAWGPGTFDMKGGLVLALAAVDALRLARIHPGKRLVFLWTSDEEIGSESSQAVIESEAKRSDAVLVLEPALGLEGKLKTARKGVGGAEIIVTGRAAHAGIAPEEGVNAVHELALQITRLMKMNDPRRGITVQATVVQGGTVSNVIPAEARAQVDLRYQRMTDALAIEEKLQGLQPILEGAQVAVKLTSSRPPMERTAGVQGLFRQAQEIASEMGITLGEAATGGGSDGNFTAALGVPTLDGLGAVGDGAHSPQEHVVIRALAERATLLAGLLATL